MRSDSTSAPDQRLRVLRGLHLGLPNYWYPIARASDLGATPVAVQRFGQALALWRDSSGQPHVFEDRCAHRAAHLSALAREPGKIRGDTIACSYHGWTYDTTGSCVARPLGNPEHPQSERLRVRVYPAEERAGLIWMYYGQDLPPPLAVPSELADAQWVLSPKMMTWHTSWLNIMDNLSDPLHQFVLHAGPYRGRRLPRYNRVRIAEASDEHIRLVSYEELEDGSTGREERFGLEVTLPNLLRVELPNAGPGGDVRVIMLMTPIDAENTLLWSIRGQRVSGWQRLRWRVHNRFFKNNRVLEQDEAILTMGPLAETRLREHLDSSDIGVIRFRSMLNRTFERSQKGAAAAQAEGHVAEALTPVALPGRG